MTENTDLVIRLFTKAVLEIAAGIVQIKAIVRKPGYRTKLALVGMNPQVDCVGVCVGIRGSRIKKIIEELDDERIDLVRWYDSPEELIASALQPAHIDQVILHPNGHRAVVKVLPDQVALVLGRNGENQRLASEISGWWIDVEEL